MLHLVHEMSPVFPVTVRTSLIPLQGVLHYMLGGVTLYINVATEESYMDLAPGFNVDVAIAFTRELPQMGFEVMDEFDGAEVFADGTMRKWLAQTWFPEVEVAAAAREMIAAS